MQVVVDASTPRPRASAIASASCAARKPRSHGRARGTQRSARSSEVEGSQNISISSKSLREPQFGLSGGYWYARFRHSRQSGLQRRRYLSQPPQGGGGSGKGSADGSGDDDFVFTLTRRRIPRSLLRGFETAEHGQGATEVGKGAPIRACRHYLRRPAGQAQSRPHHAQLAGASHSVELADAWGSRAARGGIGGGRG